jgi:hypothetical protein
MYNWQKDLWAACSGVNPKELKITMSGRNIGKSHWTNVAIKRLMDDLQSRPVEDLILREGTVFGARFYIIEPVGGNWVDMESWCDQSFGPVSNVWDMKKDKYQVGRWYLNDRSIWFRDIKDRDWFILRWRS